MNDDKVHTPELPGVRTYKKDIGEGTDSFSFGGIKLTVPDKAVQGTPDTVSGGGNVSGKKELFDVGRAFSDELVQEGTIISDRKKKRISTGDLLKSAVTEWWSNTQKSVETTVNKLEFLKPKEEQKIEAPEARTNVIQEAAKLAKQAPRDDHTLVVSKVRTFAHDAEVVTGKPFTIKEPELKVGAHWIKAEEVKKMDEPIDSEKTPLQTVDLRTSAIAPTIEKHASTPLTAYAPKIASKEPQVSAPTPVQTIKPKIPPTRTPEKLPGVAPMQLKEKTGKGAWAHFANAKKAPIDLRDKATTPIRPGITVPRVEAPAVQKFSPLTTNKAPRPERQSVAVSPSPVTFEHERSEPTTQYKPLIESRALPKVRSEPMSIAAIFANIPRSLIIGTIIVVGGGLGVLTAVLVVQNARDESEEVPQETISIPTFIAADEQIAFPLEGNRTRMYATLAELAEKSALASSQFYPTITVDGQVIPAKSEQIMEILEWRAPGTFTRALGAYTVFGSVGEPFIILQSTNFDVAFAGMLTWERNMSEDLAPLFGTALTNVGFTDALTSNRSIRILKNGDGEERIVYGFVNKNLIVITTSTEALSKVIERIK